MRRFARPLERKWKLVVGIIVRSMGAQSGDWRWGGMGIGSMGSMASLRVDWSRRGVDVRRLTSR